MKIELNKRTGRRECKNCKREFTWKKTKISRPIIDGFEYLAYRCLHCNTMNYMSKNLPDSYYDKWNKEV